MRPLKLTIPVMDHEGLSSANTLKSRLPLALRSSLGVFVKPTDPAMFTFVPRGPFSDGFFRKLQLVCVKAEAEGLRPIEGIVVDSGMDRLDRAAS